MIEKIENLNSGQNFGSKILKRLRFITKFRGIWQTTSENIFKLLKLRGPVIKSVPLLYVFFSVTGKVTPEQVKMIFYVFIRFDF
mgnify:CR=1 FL=1